MKKLFKKVFKSIKKVFKPIGKELKRGLKGVGEFFGKLGPIGTLALSLMIPGAGTLMGSFGTAVGNVAATAPFSGTIFGPVGKVIQGVAKVAQTGGKVYNSITKFVGDAVNMVTGGSFKGQMIKGPDGNMIVNEAYKEGGSRAFGNWVSQKLDNTRRMFGLETSMDAKGFDATINANNKALTGVNDVNTIVPTQTAPPIPKPESMFETSTSNRKLTDDELFAQAEQKSLLSQPKIEPKSQTFKELYPDRETIDVPIGYDETTSETLGQFANDKNSFNRINVKTKTVFKDQLTPDQIDAIDIDNSSYYADFQNNRLDKTEKFVSSMNSEDAAKLTSKNIDSQLLRQDAAAIAKPATFVGSMLAPEPVESSTGGSDGYVAPLSTDTDTAKYMGGVEQAYAGLGYKGPKTLDGYHMAGAYGNTPYNYFQIGQRSQPTMTTPMPSLI